MGLHNGEQEKTALPGSNAEHRFKSGEEEKTALPGSDGEHRLQERYNSRTRAQAFYNRQVLGYLNPAMQAFIARQEMMFVGTADKHGEADTSFRAGEAGESLKVAQAQLGHADLQTTLGVYTHVLPES